MCIICPTLYVFQFHKKYESLICWYSSNNQKKYLTRRVSYLCIESIDLNLILHIYDVLYKYVFNE